LFRITDVKFFGLIRFGSRFVWTVLSIVHYYIYNYLFQRGKRNAGSTMQVRTSILQPKPGHIIIWVILSATKCKG
jgi:hypothetical protein